MKAKYKITVAAVFLLVILGAALAFYFHISRYQYFYAEKQAYKEESGEYIDFSIELEVRKNFFTKKLEVKSGHFIFDGNEVPFSGIGNFHGLPFVLTFKKYDSFRIIPPDDDHLLVKVCIVRYPNLFLSKIFFVGNSKTKDSVVLSLQGEDYEADLADLYDFMQKLQKR